MYDRRKFKALVHYICSQRSGDPKLGAVKLNKILWLADLTAYYQLGHAITGARYVKREFGPVPHQILPIERELQNEGVLTIRDAKHYGKDKKEFIVHSMASIDFFPTNEKEIVDWAISFVCDEHTAASISEASHDHIWKAAEDGEEIPHYTVFAIPGEITQEERNWAQMQLEGAR